MLFWSVCATRSVKRTTVNARVARANFQPFLERKSLHPSLNLDSKLIQDLKIRSQIWKILNIIQPSWYLHLHDLDGVSVLKSHDLTATTLLKKLCEITLLFLHDLCLSVLYSASVCLLPWCNSSSMVQLDQEICSLFVTLFGAFLHNVTFYRGRKHPTTNFSFFFNLEPFLRIWLGKNLPAIERNGRIAMKFESRSTNSLYGCFPCLLCGSILWYFLVILFNFQKFAL